MPDPVTVGYVHGDHVAHSFHESFGKLLAHDNNSYRRVWRGGWIPTRCPTGGIVDARNDTVEAFLDTDSPWLAWLDTDMGFQPNLIDDLASVAHPAKRPIVGALCFMWRAAIPDGLGGFRCVAAPTIYDWTFADRAGKPGLVVRTEYPENELVKCDATGSACVIVHRSVFEKLGSGWYDRRGTLSEDLSFSMAARDAGFPTHVHTGIKTSHAKTIWVTEEDML